MKRLIPFFTALIILALAVYFNYEYLTNLINNSETLIRTAIVFGALILFVTSFFYIFTYNQAKRIRTLNNRLSMWTELSYHVNQVGDEVFNELPIGIVAFDEHKEIKWVNPHAKVIFNDQKLVDKYLSDINEELYQVVLNKNENAMVEIESNIYDVIIKEEYNFMYLFNVTDRELVRRKATEQTISLGIVYLDNLDESLSSMDVSDQSSLKGEYLGAINDWIDKYEGYLKPFSEGRLIFITTRKNLTKMISDKFDILDTIRNISQLHEVRVSLSIGVACWDVPMIELGVYAQNAVELAEKRGGDQVVVNIQNEKIAYFGARSDASEKSSRVSARINAQTIKQLIEQSSNVFVMGHNNADMDAFGSMLAMYHMAQSYKNHVYMVYDKERLDTTVSKVEALVLKENPEILEDAIDTEEALKRMNDDSLLIVVDTQSPKIVMSPKVLEKSKRTIVIDHHRIGDEVFNAIFTYIEPYASSAIELVVELLNFIEKTTDITPLEASIMYGGLVLDTNSFTTRTGTRTFETAYKLRELGADPSLVKTWLRRDLLRTLEINKLLSQIEIYNDKYAFILAKDIYDDRVLLAQVSDEALLISGIDAAFTIAQMANGVIGVSARSYNKVNVQVLMEAIGGGGHLSSAAAQVTNDTIEGVFEKIKHFIDLEYGEGDSTMKVILLEDVKGRGSKDQVIEVASGYGQFLITQKKALPATDENLEVLRKAKAEEELQIQKHLELMKKLKSEIDGKTVTLTIQTGQDGKAFGSITTKKVVEAFEEQNNILLDKKKVELSSEINSVGIYTANVYLHKDVKAQFEVHIIEK